MAGKETSLVTQEMLEERIPEIKKKHKVKTVFLISVEDPDTPGNFLGAYLKTPSRAQMSFVLSLFGKEKVVQGTEAILENCWLEGDERIMTEDELFFATMEHTDEFLGSTKAKLIKK